MKPDMVCIQFFVFISTSTLLNINFKNPFLKEIYAPKLQEFAYVTDGACSEEDILRMELIILKVIIISIISSSCNSIT